VDERVAKLKTAQDARRLADNAHRLGHLELEAQARRRASELQALEEGFTSPAQQAIAVALYAYEEQQTRLKGKTFRANRTRQMLARHGALAAAERVVLNRQPSQGFEVFEETGLQELSFEAIINRYPEEFSPDSVSAARARLKGEPLPPRSVAGRPLPAPSPAVSADDLPKRLDGEALAFLSGFQDTNTWFHVRWLPRYRKVTEEIALALAADRPEDVFDTFWKTPENGISAAGPGQLAFDAVDRMHAEFLQVIRDIQADGTPENYERIVERFEGWRGQGRIYMVPRLLIARAFASIHPRRYHTTVDAGNQNRALPWFVEHTGFVMPPSSSWAQRAAALVAHLDRLKIFDDPLSRNVFPWFVVEQLEARDSPKAPSAGYSPRPASAFADLPASRREICLRHNVLQAALFAQLSAAFGHGRVWIEHPTGTGGYADALVRCADGRCLLYEIKVAGTAAQIVREALGQLLEYGFRSGGLEPSQLFIVGEAALDEDTGAFLARLRSQFHLDIDYLQIGVPEGSQLATTREPDVGMAGY
jgi:hypothetical protein